MSFKKFLFLPLIPIFLLLSGCDNEVNVNAPWEEITIAYGIMNPDDSIHYVKVNKAFLNAENKPAREVAKNEDSLYHRNNITVKIQELQNGQVTKEETLRKDTLYNKEDGLFPNPRHVLYRTTNFAINPDHQYRLHISDLKQDQPVTATTPVVGDILLDYPRQRSTLSFGDVEDLGFKWQTGTNSFFYNLQINIMYANKNTQTGKITKDTVEWLVFRQQPTSSTSRTTFEHEIPSEEFFTTVSSRLERKNDIIRPVDSLFAEVIITGGGEELYNYMRVNEPSISIVQKKPEYTNINNGRGLFSSRNTLFYKMEFSPGTIDSLVYGEITQGLNFVE